jgi:putative PIN family toxin of toxin-antitoxin system
MLKIILDTNVVISALHKPDSNPEIILSAGLDNDAGICSLYLSDDIIREYREVLARDKFSYLGRDRVETFLMEIETRAVKVYPSVPVRAAVDPGDDKFLECALEARADFFITGNTKHFPFKKFGQTQIVTPQNFLEIMGGLITSELS